uniref:Protein HGH1 homolog n=1 Tax=Strigamia maritima TaxID=126957 RepID=T1J2M5_STRMM
MDDKSIAELIQFLSPKAPPHLKRIALENIVGLTSTTEGHLFFCKHTSLIDCIITLILDEFDAISEAAFTALVNLSADEILAEKIVDANNGELIQKLFEIIFRSIKCPHIELACKVLSNLSRPINCTHRIYEVVEDKKYSIPELITLFCDETFKNDYHHLAGVFCNFSQKIEMREVLLQTNASLLKRLIPFTVYSQSDARREGIVGMIKNCSFDSEVHELLLNDDLELIVYLLLPLTGPEEFDDEEMFSLPLELQYLGDTKQRDSNSSVRKIILEALTQLCATRRGRNIMKEKNVYLILRELHKWEKVPSVKLTCENIVQILISDEPPSEFENLKNVEISGDLVTKFEKMDTAALEDAENDMKDESMLDS